MTEWLYPTAFSAWGDEERAAIDCVLTSGRFTQGEEVEAFECELAAFHGRVYCVMVNSGSSANLVAIAALMNLGWINREDIVIVPAVAWSTTYAPLIQYGLNLRLVDCDDTWCSDPGWSYANARPRYLAGEVSCSILGNPTYVNDHDRESPLLLNDDCESIGAKTPSGLTTGSYGIIATQSFFFSHQVSAIEGGAILTNDKDIAKMCRMLRSHGWTRDVAATPLSFEEEYDFRCFGYNVRGLEMHAAIARSQLRKLPKMIEERQANMGLFRRLTEGLPIVHPRINGTPSPFGLHFAVKDREARNGLAVALRAAGVDCRLPTGGSFRKHAYGAPWAAQATPNADRIHDTGLFLGNAPFDIGDKIGMAVGVMWEVLR